MFGCRATFPRQRAGGSGGEPGQGDAAGNLAHASPFFIRFARCVVLRIASARMVKVGFLWAFDVNTLPSAITRLSISQLLPKLSVTELAALSPMRVVPSSWMMKPP